MLLKEKLQPYRLLLASHSPRRQQLLRDCGLEFTLIDKYDVEERYPADTEPHEVPRYLSQLKSKTYPGTLAEHEILVTADTVVIHSGQVIGKPRDRADALRILGILSGSTHEVVTGLTLRSAQAATTLSETARVTFGPLSPEQIACYVDNYRPYDKAGAYGIQEWIGYVGIERIEGSFYNVMGLPTRLLYTGLIDFLHTQQNI